MNQPNDDTNDLQTVPDTPPASILIGIDWAENEHEFCAAMPDGNDYSRRSRWIGLAAK
jgi:hypothetical protein